MTDDPAGRGAMGVSDDPHLVVVDEWQVTLYLPRALPDRTVLRLRRYTHGALLEVVRAIEQYGVNSRPTGVAVPTGRLILTPDRR